MCSLGIFVVGANVGKIIQAVEEMKASIQQLKQDIADAKARQTEASKDIKRIEKDMKDFDNNKDNKLAELQSALNTLKKSQIKNSICVKNLQKELQSSRLEAEQAGADLSAAQEQLAEVDSTLKAQEAEVEGLQKQQIQAKVSVQIPSESINTETSAGCTGYRTGAPR